jgi:hypothetical protein
VEHFVVERVRVPARTARQQDLHHNLIPQDVCERQILLSDDLTGLGEAPRTKPLSQFLGEGLNLSGGQSNGTCPLLVELLFDRPVAHESVLHAGHEVLAAQGRSLVAHLFSCLLQGLLELFRELLFALLRVAGERASLASNRLEPGLDFAVGVQPPDVLGRDAMRLEVSVHIACADTIEHGVRTRLALEGGFQTGYQACISGDLASYELQLQLVHGRPIGQHCW